MEGLLSLPLLWMVVSDFRKRTVQLIPLLLFGAMVLGWAWYVRGWERLLGVVIVNATMLGLLFGTIRLYLKIRYGRKTRWQQFAGSGDLFFLCCLIPAFEPVAFIRFLVWAFLVALAGWGMYYTVTRKHTTIPLVSAIGAVYFIYIWVYGA